MATQLADILFVLIATAIAVSQVVILRSTARGMRHAAGHADAGRNRGTAHAALEWSYAIVPAVGLVFLLLFTWRAMHPAAVKVQGVAPSSTSGT